MSEWSFQRKLTTGVILICVLAILTSVTSLFASRSLIVSIATVSRGEGQDVSDARALHLIGAKNIADSHASLLTGESGFAAAAQAGNARAREIIARLKSRTLDSEGRALLDSVAGAERAHEDAFLHALAVAVPGESPSQVQYPASVLLSSAHYDATLATLGPYFESASARSLASARLNVARAESLLLTFSIVMIVLMVLLCLILSGVLTKSYAEQTVARTQAEARQTEALSTLSDVEAASRLKDEFLATVSHELRNPLAPILTWTQLLRSGTLDKEKSVRALEVIERNVMSQVQLIDDLVDVSRVVSGKFRLDVRPLDLVAVIRSATDSQTPASDAKDIRLQLMLDEGAGTISGDAERLQQVMGNLVSNAIKFTPTGGRVQVVLQQAPSHIEIIVSDTGIGIDAGFLPHIFEPFQQATVGSMRRHAGLGLGLSIVRHIVELHGGEITGLSEGLGLGSKFTIRFPLLATGLNGRAPAQRRPATLDRAAATQPDRLDGIRVLIVDDEPSASEALQVLMMGCGADVRVADSARQALALFDTWQPEVLISDIAMPGEDGYSLIRKIRMRSSERGGLIPAVALTAYAKIEDRVTILAAGFQMYLSKPADPNELVAVVNSLARRSDVGDLRGV
ncbi:MAG: ATP-binding protein [Candidatus Eisenbacteria bacterium]